MDRFPFGYLFWSQESWVFHPTRWTPPPKGVVVGPALFSGSSCSYLAVRVVYFLVLVYLTESRWSPSQLQVFPKWHPPQWPQSSSPRIAGPEIAILFWTPFFGSKSLDWMRTCPQLNCRVVANRTEIQRQGAVVLFHARDLNQTDLPSVRFPSQSWVFFLMESPTHTGNLRKYDNLFNLTMTYRYDSDVWYPYVTTRPLETVSEPLDIEQLVSTKTKQVAWVVFNCGTASNRESYVAELKKHIPVDTFGGWGKSKCEGIQGCVNFQGPRYKFYLSLENSLCQDYITEKFGNPLMYHLVPIVYGGANYSNVSPPHSYIDTRDYSTPKDLLAAYLRHLDRNPKQYLEYFRWKYRMDVIGYLLYSTSLKFISEHVR